MSSGKKRRKLLFVGMAPSSTSDPLVPLDSRSGRALAGLFGYEAVSEFADAVNVLERYPGKANKKGDKFPMKKARRALPAIASLFGEYEAVVLLGRKVATLFELDWFETRMISGAFVCGLPHTSGSNLWWTNSENRARARRFSLGIKRLAKL